MTTCELKDIAYECLSCRSGPIAVLTPVVLVLIVGCSAGEGKQSVSGAITVGGQVPDSGEIRFIPIGDTPGPASGTVIDNGMF